MRDKIECPVTESASIEFSIQFSIPHVECRTFLMYVNRKQGVMLKEQTSERQNKISRSSEKDNIQAIL